MAGDKFKNSEFFDENFLQPLIDKTKQAIDQIDLLTEGLKRVAETAGTKLVSIPADSVDNLKKINDALNDVEHSENGLAVAMKEREKLSKKLDDLTSSQAVEVQKLKEQINEQNKANKQAARDSLGLTTAYQKESRTLNELRNAYKDLAIRGRENGVVGRALLQTITEQDQKLKSLDASVGQYQRNVGNYGSAFKEFGKNVKGVGGLLGATAEAFGIEDEKLQAFIGRIEKFGKIFKEFNELKEHSTELSEVGAVATEAEAVATGSQAVATEGLATAEVSQAAGAETATVAQEGLNAAMKANPIGAIIAAVIALGAALYFLNEFLTGSSEETKILERENTRLLKAYEKQKVVTEARVKVLESEIDVLRAQGAPLEEIRKKQDEINKEKETELLLNIETIKSSIALNKQKIQDVITNDSVYESILKMVEATQRFLGQEKQADLTLAVINKNKKERAEEFLTALEEQENALILAEADYEAFKNSLLVQEAEFNKEAGELAKARTEQIKKENEERAKLYRADAQAKIDAEKDKLAFLEKVRDFENGITEDKRTNIEKEDDRYQTQLLRLESLSDAAKEKGVFSQERYNQDLEAIDQQHIDNVIALQQEENDEIIALQEDQRDAALEAIEKEIEARRKKLEEAVALEEQLSDAVNDGLERRFDARQDSLKSEVSDIDKQLAIQQDLFNRGLQNQLAFQERERAKAIEKQLALEKQKRKAEQAQELSGVFLELLKGYAKEGSIDAPAKALAQTLIAKGVADAIAGDFAEGVEGLDGKGTATSDSNLARLSKGESVITADATSSNPGLATAWNHGKLDEYFQQVYLPQYESSLVPDDIAARTNVDPYSRMYSMLQNKVDNLERAVRESKDDVQWDSFGNLVRAEVQQGLKTVHIKKRFS